MNYWWVNQNQTHKQEISGKYMWSPKVNRNGAYNHYYNNMTLVRPGDLVYSFFGTKIQYIGTVESHGYSYGKPDEFGTFGDYWNKDGWRVDVIYKKLDNIISPRDYIDKIRDLLPEKYSPLQSNGNGNQIYLTYIPEDFANKLNDIIGSQISKIKENSLNYIGIGSSEVDAVQNQQVREIQRSKNLTFTEKERLVNSRIGQGQYRKEVLTLHRKCPFTGISNHKFLRAGHLKPWAESSNVERLDSQNGLALTPTYDLLVDRGFISFDNSGRILISSELSQNEKSDLNLLNNNYQIQIKGEKHREFIKYHRENIFKK